jgi:hypothetical protein
MSYRMGLGATCPTPADMTYGTTCPAGFSLLASYYVPNSEVVNATASTPGAIPLPSPTNPACPQYACQTTGGLAPGQVDDAYCSTQPTMLLTEYGPPFGAALLALFALPGGWKLLSIPAFLVVSLLNVGSPQATFNAQGQQNLDANGNPICQFVRGGGL